MIKFKHNKKRNSALLYEVLIQELTKSLIVKNEDRRSKIISLIKESFKKDTLMYKELKLYRAISHTKEVTVLTAEKIIQEVKRQHSILDGKKLMVEQNKLLKKIRKTLSDDVFSNFVPNYKNLASISQIFNKSVAIKSKILLENQLINNMSRSDEEEPKLVPIDNIVYKAFSKRFNEEYGEKLLQEQKTLLNKFITSFQNNGVELAVYLNEEIGRLKKEMAKYMNIKEIQSDEHMIGNSKKVLDLLESYKKQKPNKEMVQEVIKIQKLVQELKSSGG